MGKGHSQRKRDAKKRKAEAEAMAAQTSSASAPSANYQRSLLAGASSELASATQLEPAPAPAMSEQDRRNYERFLKFLLKFAVITSYTIYVSYDSMLQHNDVDLIVAICNSHTRSHRATDAHLILFRALRIGYFVLPVNSYAMKILETKTAEGTQRFYHGVGVPVLSDGLKACKDSCEQTFTNNLDIVHLHTTIGTIVDMCILGSLSSPMHISSLSSSAAVSASSSRPP